MLKDFDRETDDFEDEEKEEVISDNDDEVLSSSEDIRQSVASSLKTKVTFRNSKESSMM